MLCANPALTAEPAVYADCSNGAPWCSCDRLLWSASALTLACLLLGLTLGGDIRPGIRVYVGVSFAFPVLLLCCVVQCSITHTVRRLNISVTKQLTDRGLSAFAVADQRVRVHLRVRDVRPLPRRNGQPSFPVTIALAKALQRSLAFLR